MVKLSPSIFGADFGKLNEQIKAEGEKENEAAN